MSIFDSKDDVVNEAIQADRIFTILNLSKLYNIKLWIVFIPGKGYIGNAKCVSGIIFDTYKGRIVLGKNNPQYKYHIGGTYIFDDTDIFLGVEHYDFDEILEISLKQVDIEKIRSGNSDLSDDIDSIHMMTGIKINDGNKYCNYLSQMLSYKKNTNIHNLTPKEVYQTIANKVVTATLKYINDVTVSSNKLSFYAGGEILYLLMHLVYRKADNQLDQSCFGGYNPEIDNVFKEASNIAIIDYVKSSLGNNLPEVVYLDKTEPMMVALNERHDIYDQCPILSYDKLPSKGTMEFAFSFFVHRALGRTNIKHDEEILIGDGDISDDYLEELPNPKYITHAAKAIRSAASSLRIHDDLKHLE